MLTTGTAQPTTILGCLLQDIARDTERVAFAVTNDLGEENIRLKEQMLARSEMNLLRYSTSADEYVNSMCRRAMLRLKIAAALKS
jgi:hypothetical protein